MITNGTHGPHNAPISHWPASAGHSCAYWLKRLRGSRFIGRRLGIQTGAIVFGHWVWLARGCCVAPRTTTAFFKSP